MGLPSVPRLRAVLTPGVLEQPKAGGYLAHVKATIYREVCSGGER